MFNISSKKKQSPKSTVLCVDTGEQGFPGLQGQKGDRGQSLRVILPVADVTQATMSKILRKCHI